MYLQPSDWLYIFLMMQVGGFIVGITYSFFFSWVRWESGS